MRYLSRAQCRGIVGFCVVKIAWQWILESCGDENLAPTVSKRGIVCYKSSICSHVVSIKRLYIFDKRQFLEDQKLQGKVVSIARCLSHSAIDIIQVYALSPLQLAIAIQQPPSVHLLLKDCYSREISQFSSQIITTLQLEDKTIYHPTHPQTDLCRLGNRPHSVYPIDSPLFCNFHRCCHNNHHQFPSDSKQT